MITAGSLHLVLADPPRCNIQGWPSCYNVGYQHGLANPGTNSPSGKPDAILVDAYSTDKTTQLAERTGVVHGISAANILNESLESQSTCDNARVTLLKEFSRLVNK